MATTTAPAKAGSATGADDAEAGAVKKKKLTPLRLVILIVVAVLLLGGGGAGGYWYLAIRVPPPEPPPVPGDVVAFDAISINLADGHYLKVGIALQLAVAAAGGGHGAKVVVDGSKAKDLAIEHFSGMTVEELANPEIREEVKEELFEDVEEAYHENHHEVLGLYFTDFVTQ